MDASRLRVVLLLVLTFAAGAAGGIAADRLGFLPGFARAQDARSERPRQRSSGPAGREDGETTIERFADHLGLSPEQRAEIDGVLEHYRTSMRGIWQEVRPRYRTLVDSVRTRIENVLTPEQVTEYRALLERRYRDRDDDDEGERHRSDGDGDPGQGPDGEGRRENDGR